MIDFWEALGRLVCDEELSRKFETVVTPLSAALPHTILPHKPIDIEDDAYNVVQSFWEPVLTQPYLSLMAAGELIWAYRFDESRQAMKTLQGIIAETKPKLHNPSTSYLIALGSIIADELLRPQVAHKKPNPLAIRRLSAPEQHHLTSLAANESFGTAAVRFCDGPWDGGCNVRMLYWEGHLHPRGIDEPTKKKKQMAASVADHS